MMIADLTDTSCFAKHISHMQHILSIFRNKTAISLARLISTASIPRSNATGVINMHHADSRNDQ